MVVNKHAFFDAFNFFQNYTAKGRSLFSWPELFLKIFGIGKAVNGEFWSIAIGGIGYIVACYLAGWWWDSRRYYHREADWANERNPFVKKMEEKIK